MVAPLDLQIQHLELWVSGNDKEKRKQFCEAIEMARLRGEIDFLWSATLAKLHQIHQKRVKLLSYVPFDQLAKEISDSAAFYESIVFLFPIASQEDIAVEHAKQIVREIVLKHLPEDFMKTAKNFYSDYLDGLRQQTSTEGGMMQSQDQKMNETGRFLKQAGLFSYVKGIVLNMLSNEMMSFVNSRLAEGFNEPILDKLNSWACTCLLAWFLRFAYINENSELYIEWKRHFQTQTLKIYTDSCIRYMFDIIVDYPDSLPILEEFKRVLAINDQRKKLVKELIKTLRRRLLQPGAKTSDIIDQYVSMIKCFKVIDTDNLMVGLVVGEVKDYLRKRPDILSVLIVKLFEDENDELAAELRNTQRCLLDGYIEDNYEEDLDTDWRPTLTCLGSKVKLQRSNFDVLNSLIQIQGGIDNFVDEFHSYLANRLLSLQAFDNEKEIGFVELLKYRLGDSKMHNSEVMLKDISDSKRTDLLIHDALRRKHSIHAFMHATAISHLFWPQLKSTKFKFPQKIQRSFAEYSDLFTSVRRSRYLKWLPELGNVDLSLDLPDGSSFRLTVSPIHATIISMFEERDEWSLDQLMIKLEMDKAYLIQKMSFWISQGVIEDCNGDDTYKLISGKEAKGSKEDFEVYDASAAMSVNERRDAEMQIYWTYIVGMLTNLGPSQPAKIQTMLNMFVQAPNKYDRTLEELQQFLESMAQAGKLEFNGGKYSVKR